MGYFYGSSYTSLEEAKEKYYLGCERKDENEIWYLCEKGYILDEEKHTCNLYYEEFEESSDICEYWEHGNILLNEKIEFTSCYTISGNSNEDPEDAPKENNNEENSFKLFFISNLSLILELIILI